MDTVHFQDLQFSSIALILYSTTFPIADMAVHVLITVGPVSLYCFAFSEFHWLLLFVFVINISYSSLYGHLTLDVKI
jgi:hypothetical protein